MLLDEVQTRSDAYSEVLKIVRRVSDTDANILVTGETGTGKDFIAGLIHDASARRAAPFLKIDCASIPDSLAESEFFGYEKGAFSDAFQNKAGKLQMAEGGTLYFDGVNHLSAAVQSKLLRFVQERVFEPLGSSKTVTVRCRIVSSCTLPLDVCIKQKQLREDLYFRLAGVTIELPPLRKRVEDIEALARSFMIHLEEKYRKKSDLSVDALLMLKQYHWPGNLREFRNLLENAFIQTSGSIAPVDLPLLQSATHSAFLVNAADKLMSLEDLERIYISEVLRNTRGHTGKAAAILGISRKTLLLKRRKYGIGR